METNFRNYIKQNKILLAILLICFGLSVFYSFYYQIKPQVDARAYDVIAQNIAGGNGYRQDLNVSIKDDTALLRVGPTYEYFLAGIYMIFGHHYEVVWVVQAFLRVLSVFFLYLSVLLVFKNSDSKKRIALWSSAIFAFYPDLIEISAMLMTETFYLFFVCLTIYLFFKYLDSPKWFWLIMLSVVSGLAVLARPPMLFFLPVIFFYLLINKRWKEIVVYGFVLCAVFAPWSIRNYKIYGAPMPFGVAGSVNFWIGNHVGANGEQETNKEINDFINTNNIRKIEDKSISQFEDFVFNHLKDFVMLSLSRVSKYFSILRPMGFWFYTSGWRQILFVLSSAIFSFLVLILSLGGVIQSIKFREEKLNYLLAFTIITPLILFITVVETRYRFQIYPFLAIFSAYFIESFSQNKKLWLKILFLAFVLILINGMADGIVNFNHFRDKIIGYL